MFELIYILIAPPGFGIIPPGFALASGFAPLQDVFVIMMHGRKPAVSTAG
jgi:hypothetical protein